MAHTASAPHGAGVRPGILLAIVLAGAIGFALGQSWPVGTGTTTPTAQPVLEDWHGNVMRSHWPQ
ncbi:MAG: hypothetical protein AB3N21_10850 [Ruegeria sp.]|uniref:hypothetical protein n=1 Tax=Ruegeria sp. TaxID=1879320 RepID=UPI00349E59FF